MMADSEMYTIGRRVKVVGKDVEGVIAFYGTTNFAAEKWLGLKLDEPKGKNNGTVQGVEYFKCEEKCGLFVKPSQVTFLSEQHKRPQEENKPRSRQSGIPSKTKPTSSRMSMPSNWQSLSSSRQSLSSSRNSLTSSRQSLTGSRTHLDSTIAEKPTSIEVSSQIPKRSSFVETGFVETFEPHFTPGQIITPTPTPITSVEDKINIVQLQHEIDTHKQQITDLHEKLETLRIRRQEDREKLKEFDKLKIQHEHLMEFKSKIMEAQANLQRELQRAKQEARDAIDAKNLHAEEMADLAETVEMATLDREMAEEKAESLQLELDHCKEKLEETKLDLEMLRAEVQGRTEGSGDGSGQTQISSSYELKQLQQQNVRLKDTLVRLRDLSAHDKHEYQKLQKDVEQKKSEIIELGKTKEKLSSRVEALEQQVGDLQEQVDAALGAEEMVVNLAEQKLNLEEKLSQLQEEVTELEALQEMNDQLVESNAELEADLREELDLALAETRRVQRERDAAIETIADRESTICKFRELVQKLQEQSMQLRQRLEQEVANSNSSKPSAVGASMLPDIVDFTKMFCESKAHTKAIDLELRQIDIEQLREHIKYLLAYMPDSFLCHGSDHDAVLTLLLIPRLLQKCAILSAQIKEKFPVAEANDRATIRKSSHTVEQYNFRLRLTYNLNALQCVLNQYSYGLNTCSANILLKVGASHADMVQQEKLIDGFVELLRRNQLDENVPIDGFERCSHYFYALFPVVFSGDHKINHVVLIGDFIRALLTASDGLQHSAIVIKNLLQVPNIGDIAELCNYIITSSESFQQQCKVIKRRLQSISNVFKWKTDDDDIFENLHQSYIHLCKILKTLYEVIKAAIKSLTSSDGGEEGLTAINMKEIAISASDKIYEQDDLGPSQSVRQSVEFVEKQCVHVSTLLQDYESKVSVVAAGSSNQVGKDERTMITPPIQIRTDIVRSELAQIKTLTNKVENKESDIKELRKLLKDKQEVVSEMTIRKELAEKKLANVNKDYELTMEKLQRKLTEAQNYTKKKEKEFEETLDHLQTDIDSLESERGEMKEKLRHLSKKAQTDLSVSLLSMVTSSSLSSHGQMPSLSGGGPTLPAVVRDSPLLLQEISNLRTLWSNEHHERLKCQTDTLAKRFAALAPLPNFNATEDTDFARLLKEGVEIKQKILTKLSRPVFPAVHKIQPNSTQQFWMRHLADEHNQLMKLNESALLFRRKVVGRAVERSKGKIEADFAVFPTVDLLKALTAENCVNIGFVKIPSNLLDATDTSRIVDLNLNHKHFQQLLNSLVDIHA